MLQEIREKTVVTNFYNFKDCEQKHWVSIALEKWPLQPDPGYTQQPEEGFIPWLKDTTLFKALQDQNLKNYFYLLIPLYLWKVLTEIK